MARENLTLTMDSKLKEKIKIIAIKKKKDVSTLFEDWVREL